MAKRKQKRIVRSRERPLVLLSGLNGDAIRPMVELAREWDWELRGTWIPSADLPPERPVAGALIKDLPVTPLAQRLREADCPAVRFGARPHPDDNTLPAVLPDLAMSGRLAAEHFASRQFQDVAFVGHNPEDVSANMHAAYVAFRERAGELDMTCHVLSLQSSNREGDSTSEREAQQLLLSRSKGEGRPIPRRIGESILDTVGTCPFYLQVIGAELCRMQTIDEDAFKVVLQRVLFDADGRLHLYFSNLVSRIVGRSASIERTLIALASQPGRLSDVAGRLGVAPGTLKSWIDRCRDLVVVEDAIYRINDPCLALWLRGKSAEGPVLPTVVLGDEAEKRVAKQMASAGFELVFQSRTSRGAFDLLAVQGSTEIGVQVKKASRPFYLSRDELGRMKHWAKRLGWVPVLALVEEDEVVFYDVTNRRPSGKGCRFDSRTPQIENLLDLSQKEI